MSIELHPISSVLHLRPDLNKGPWTAEEDAALVEAHRAVGNRWSEIARRLPGRPENAIKNRWNSTVRARGRVDYCAEGLSPFRSV